MLLLLLLLLLPLLPRSSSSSSSSSNIMRAAGRGPATWARRMAAAGGPGNKEIIHVTNDVTKEIIRVTKEIIHVNSDDDILAIFYPPLK